MLVFTMISRAVSGASMARVETVKISTGTIDHKVSGSGKVEAGKEVAVFTEGGQRVKEICVQEGQSVEEGDTLFLLDLEELEEQVLAAQQELENHYIALRIYLAEHPADYISFSLHIFITYYRPLLPGKLCGPVS